MIISTLNFLHPFPKKYVYFERIHKYLGILIPPLKKIKYNSLLTYISNLQPFTKKDMSIMKENANI